MSDFTELESFLGKGLMKPYITHMRFPRFKNLQPGFRIDFLYPITALVGPNGTNKSSILRALEGCPNKYNIGDRWFDTELDPIADGEPQRYIHGYITPGGSTAEVIKARVGKSSRGPDYFETSAPRIRDGMESMPGTVHPKDALVHMKTRWKPIEKEVVYLDFRQELPAYDIFMNFNWRRNPNEVADKKRSVRRGAVFVAKALDTLKSEHRFHGVDRILEPAEELGVDEVRAISVILGREYISIRLVKHDYFGAEGYTARLTTKFLNYSEAYAGSGEFAAVMLVRAVSQAPARSLILLDEPETSLHPGAQVELMRFIARKCLQHQHQVILCTHAPAMISELPEAAIKLFDLSPSTGQVQLVAQEASQAEAFSRLGLQFTERTVIVEDTLAKEFVERVARLRGKDYLASIRVIAVPGGASSLVKRIIPTQAQLSSACILLLDGDMRPAEPIRNSDEVLESEIEIELKKIGIERFDILRNGGNSDSFVEFVKQGRKTLAWINDHLDYLPGDGNPEQLLLQMSPAPENVNSKIAKQRWKEITRSALGLLEDEHLGAAEILSIQREVLAAVPDSDERLVSLAEILQQLLPAS